jgi:hypothetical protein
MLNLGKLKALYRERNKPIDNPYQEKYYLITKEIIEFWNYVYNHEDKIINIYISQPYHPQIQVRYGSDNAPLSILITLDKKNICPPSMTQYKGFRIKIDKNIEDVTGDDVDEILLKFGEELRINHILYKEDN